MSEPHDHLRAFLEAIGLDATNDPHLASTPQRVAELLGELFANAAKPEPTMSVFEAEDESPIHLIGMPFRSMCVHHLVPFFGTIDIAYVPDESIAGFGSFGRVVEWAAGRPQIQERMTRQIADALEEQLAPSGLLVRCRARQLCVEMTSGRPGSYISLVSRGSLESGPVRDAAIAQFTAAETPL